MTTSRMDLTAIYNYIGNTLYEKPETIATFIQYITIMESSNCDMMPLSTGNEVILAYTEFLLTGQSS